MPLFQQGGQLFGDFFGGDPGCEACDHFSVGVDEELLEIPLNVRRVAVAGVLSLEPVVEFGRVIAVDVDHGEHREVDVVVVVDESSDLFSAARFLARELIAREAQNVNSVVFVVERTQTCVLLRQASSGSDVDDQAGPVSKR